MKGNDYLSDLKEWQEHHNSKGYYSGGNLPPMCKYSSGIQPSFKSTLKTALLLLGGLISESLCFVILVLDNYAWNIIHILSAVTLGLAGVALLVAGIRSPAKTVRKKKRKKRK